MKKNIQIHNISYDLYHTSITNIAEEYLLDSLTYNGGLDYFLGSDCISVYVYLVEKSKVPEFIDIINAFIIQCEQIALSKDTNAIYLESVADFSFIHKHIEQSKYDIFISNFDTPMIQKNYDETVKIYEIFIKKIQSISVFSITAGAEYNDYDILNFSINYLFNNKLKVFDEKEIERHIKYNYKDFPMINNTDNENIIEDFIKLYWNAIPEFSKEYKDLLGL